VTQGARRSTQRAKIDGLTSAARACAFLLCMERAQRAVDADPALQLTQLRHVVDRVSVRGPRGQKHALPRDRKSRVREPVVWMIESVRQRDEPIERSALYTTARSGTSRRSHSPHPTKGRNVSRKRSSRDGTSNGSIRPRLCENSDVVRATSKFRGLSPRRARKITKILTLCGHMESLAEFSHSLDPLQTFQVGPMNGREARESGLRLTAHPPCKRPKTRPRRDPDKIESRP
jgi:hypothetical protein